LLFLTALGAGLGAAFAAGLGAATAGKAFATGLRFDAGLLAGLAAFLAALAGRPRFPAGFAALGATLAFLAADLAGAARAAVGADFCCFVCSFYVCREKSSGVGRRGASEYLPKLRGKGVIFSRLISTDHFSRQDLP
jgi:hypothetical protein